MRNAFIYLAIICCLAAGALADPGAPDDSRALSNGIAQVGAGNYAAAILTLQPLEAEDEGDSLLQYWLGRAYYGQHNYRIAVRHLAAAAERDATNEQVCYWYARTLRMAGDYAGAVEAYAVYLPRFPRNDYLQIDYAVARALAGDLPGARAVLEQFMARKTPAEQRVWKPTVQRLTDALAARERLEPPLLRRAAAFTLCYTPAEKSADTVFAEVERARARIGAAMGSEITGFRVLLFADWESYSRYAALILPDGQQLHAVAVSTPGALLLCSPMAWPRDERTTETLRKILDHELSHLALLQRNRGEGLPVWLNEGIACYFGGWGGLRTGRLPVDPLSPAALEQAFTAGDENATNAAYAQAHAMVTVMVKQLDVPGLFKLVDLLAVGTPLPVAYAQAAGEPWTAFLAGWPKRYQAPR